MQYASIDNLARIKSGYPFRGPVRHDPKGDVRVVQIRDLRRPEGLEAEGLTRVQAPRKYNAHLLEPGDIVMPARGDHLRAISYAAEEPSIATIASSQLYTLRTSGEEVLPAYLAWALNQPAAQHTMQNEARGTAMPLLARDSLGAIRIPVPPLTTQRRIVELYELWQRERALTQELLTNRERMLRGTIQQLMTQEQDGDDR